jgi:hypothetical protein
MTRAEFEHFLRAVAAIAGEDKLIVVGSQSILGSCPDAPAELCVSNGADLYPRHRPELADLIDGSIGEGSPFDDTFGDDAQGIGPTTAVLPEDWESRLVAVSGPGARGATGGCFDPHDLVVSRLVAGREKDLRFARAAAEAGLVQVALLRERLAATDVDATVRALVAGRIDALAAEAGCKQPVERSLRGA